MHHYECVAWPNVDTLYCLSNRMGLTDKITSDVEIVIDNDFRIVTPAIGIEAIYLRLEVLEKLRAIAILDTLGPHEILPIKETLLEETCVSYLSRMHQPASSIIFKGGARVALAPVERKRLIVAETQVGRLRTVSSSCTPCLF